MTPIDELARGEVGKVGVSVAHKGDMRALLDGIPLDQMNTSMTINATAAWLLALYIVAAESAGSAEMRSRSQGTTQNDILKEYLSRGTYAFPPGPSMRLIADTIAYTVTPRARDGTRSTSAPTTCRRRARRRSRRSPTRSATRSRCSTPSASAGRPRSLMGDVFGRISFFVNAGVRFIEEHAKLRAMSRCGSSSAASATASPTSKHAALPLRRPGQLARD